jgi:hypothetical protein
MVPAKMARLLVRQRVRCECGAKPPGLATRGWNDGISRTCMTRMYIARMLARAGMIMIAGNQGRRCVPPLIVLGKEN